MSPTTDEITAGAEVKASIDVQIVKVWLVSPDHAPGQVFADENIAITAWRNTQDHDQWSVRPIELEIPVRVRASRDAAELARARAALAAQMKEYERATARIAILEDELVEATTLRDAAPKHVENQAPISTTPLHVDNRAPIYRTYVARAQENDRGGGYVAKYTFPGGVLRVVYAAGENVPAVFATAEAAESEARRVLVESLNARYRSTESRNVISKKLTGDEFADELAQADITPSEWAQMWGTKQDTVVAQIQGEKEVPFAARWILPVLRAFDGAIDMAQRIVAENTTVKPEWIERKRKHVENEEGR